MGKGNHTSLRVVGADGLTAEDMLRMAEPSKKPGKLEVWLSRQDKHTSALFWETMAMARERGMPFDTVYRSFMAHFADGQLPLGTRWAKQVVDAGLSDR